MGREGFEPSTLGLKVGPAGLALSRVVSEKRLAAGVSQVHRRLDLGSSLPVSLSPCCHPGGAMNAPSESPGTQDPSLRALIERGLAQAQAREAAAGLIEEPSLVVGPPAETMAPPPRTLGLTSDRACVETNLARKGLWRSASGAEAEGGELVRLLDATDQLGMVQRIDSGPPLGALAFDVVVWACTRWRELGDADERRVPITLEAMAGDLGWRKGEAPPPSSRGRSTPFASRPSGPGSTTPASARPASIPSASSTAGSAASPTGPGAPRERAFSSSETGFTSSLLESTSPSSAGRSCGRFEAAPLAGSWSTSRPSALPAHAGDGRSTSHFSRLSGSPPSSPSTSARPCAARPRRSSGRPTATSG